MNLRGRGKRFGVRRVGWSLPHSPRGDVAYVREFEHRDRLADPKDTVGSREEGCRFGASPFEEAPLVLGAVTLPGQDRACLYASSNCSMSSSVCALEINCDSNWFGVRNTPWSFIAGQNSRSHRSVSACAMSAPSLGQWS